MLTINDPDIFLAWLRKRAAAKPQTANTPLNLKFCVDTVLANIPTQGVTTSRDFVRIVAMGDIKLVTNCSDVEKKFIDEVTDCMCAEDGFFSKTIACFILGWLLGDLQFWFDDATEVGALTWSPPKARRLGVNIDVPINWISMHLCLDWVEAYSAKKKSIKTGRAGRGRSP